MSAFRYVEPRSVGDAIGILADAGPDVHILAGGASLVPLIKLGFVQPEVVVGLRGLTELRDIVVRDGGLVIGSLASLTDVADSAIVRSGWPLLSTACGVVGTVRIRNQGTLGGNLAHADPNQDPPPALLVLDATVALAGPSGERRVAIADLFVDVFETSLEPGEVLIEVAVPALPTGSRTAYRKFLPRSQDDYATVAVAALARTDADGRVVDARVALGGVGPRPVRAAAVEQSLIGKVVSPASIAAAAAEVDREIDPIEDVRGSVAYKRAMARVWVERALADVCRVDAR